MKDLSVRMEISSLFIFHIYIVYICIWKSNHYCALSATICSILVITVLFQFFHFRVWLSNFTASSPYYQAPLCTSCVCTPWETSCQNLCMYLSSEDLRKSSDINHPGCDIGPKQVCLSPLKWHLLTQISNFTVYRSTPKKVLTRFYMFLTSLNNDGKRRTFRTYKDMVEWSSFEH